MRSFIFALTAACGLAHAQVIDPIGGHAYERVLVAGGVDWNTANTAAQMRSFQGHQGHLAALTTPGEVNFLPQLGDVRGCWIGGLQNPGSVEPDGGWVWVTGEAWNYTNWAGGEPNNMTSYRGLNANEDRLIINWGGGLTWLDAASILSHPDDTKGYIVEYDLPPNPMLRADGHAYLLVRQFGITWINASFAAANMSYRGVAGHLVTITSAQEQAFLTSNFGDLRGVWYGGMQTSGSNEPGSGWVWITGEPWTYSNWYPGEPNDNRSYHGQNANENALIGWSTDGLWNDLASTNGRSDDTTGYIVEFDASPPCVADFDDGSGTGTPDGGVTIDDLLYYLGLFAAGDLRADIDDGSGTGMHDQGVTIDDLLYFLTHFAAGC